MLLDVVALWKQSSERGLEICMLDSKNDSSGKLNTLKIINVLLI